MANNELLSADFHRHMRGLKTRSNFKYVHHEVFAFVRKQLDSYCDLSCSQETRNSFHSCLSSTSSFDGSGVRNANNIKQDSLILSD